MTLGVQHLSRLIAAEEGVLDMPSLELLHHYTRMAELYAERAAHVKPGTLSAAAGRAQ